MIFHTMTYPLLFKIFSIFLPLVFIFWLIQTQHLSASRIKVSRCGTHYNDSPREVLKEFTKHASLEDLSHGGDPAWDTELLTPHGGFLIVRRNETTNEKWGVSMFHGLHCLQIVRAGLQRAREMGMSSMPDDHDNHQQQHSAHLDKVHLQHCFGYIAQSLMCFADDTIEPPQEEYDKNGNLINLNVDGMGITHRCRDSRYSWDTVRRSEESPNEKWDWEIYDTVETVFGPF